MKLTLIIFGVLGCLELVLWLPGIQRLRKSLAYLLIAGVLIVGLLVFTLIPHLSGAVFLLIGLYRAFNLYRVIKGRMHERYLQHAVLRSSLLLILAQLGVLGVAQLLHGHMFDAAIRWQILVWLQLLFATILLTSTLRQLYSAREPILIHSYPDRELPTLSVAIPARNETADLEDCLKTLLANDYPKLEILVLDDCSQNAKTPEIIRQFAHDGVTFVAGSEPADSWLAKNWAYERLREEANGELMLFCGVDTRFVPDALRKLVMTLLDEHMTMISYMPANAEPVWRALLVQPVRYAWELVLPRGLLKRPPVLSTCWLIKKSFLDHSGGFKAVSRSIVPESYFARQALQANGYRFLRTAAVLTSKPFAEQRATAVRTRYPQLHHRPEQVVLVSLIELVGIIGPFVICIAAAWQRQWFVASLSGGASLLLMAVYDVVLWVTYRKMLVLAAFLLPLAALYDIAIMQYSMLKYELSEVIWKGRNVCIPVMHVRPSLPAMAEAKITSDLE